MSSSLLRYNFERFDFKIFVTVKSQAEQIIYRWLIDFRSEFISNIRWWTAWLPCGLLRDWSNDTHGRWRWPAWLSYRPQHDWSIHPRVRWRCAWAWMVERWLRRDVQGEGSLTYVASYPRGAQETMPMVTCERKAWLYQSPPRAPRDRPK